MGCFNIGNYHEPNVDWLIIQLQKAVSEWDELKNELSNIDLTELVNNKMNEYVSDGTMLNIINNSVLNRHFLIVGDSYALGYSQSGALYTPFPEYITANSNINLETIATSGAGFANIGTGPGEGKNFLSTLEAYQGNKQSITDIIVCGGYNDRTHDSVEITNAIKSFYAYVTQKFINAKIHIAFIGWSLNPTEYESLRSTAQIYSRCGLYGIAYIGGSENILHQQSYFDSDGIHPNNLGQEMIGNYLASYLRNGSVDVFKDLGALNFTEYNGINIPTLYCTQHNNNIIIYTQGCATLNLSALSGVNWSANFTRISGKLTDSPFLGYFTAVINTVILYRKESDTDYSCCPCTMRITGGILYAQFLIYDNGVPYTGKLQDVIMPGISTTIDSILS